MVDYPLHINYIIARNEDGSAFGIMNRYEEVFAGFDVNNDPRFVADMAQATTFHTLEDAKMQAYLLARADAAAAAPPMCKNPFKCAGQGYCREEIACND